MLATMGMRSKMPTGQCLDALILSAAISPEWLERVKGIGEGGKKNHTSTWNSLLNEIKSNGKLLPEYRNHHTSSSFSNRI